MSDEWAGPIHLRYYPEPGWDGVIRTLCRREDIPAEGCVFRVSQATCTGCVNRAITQWWAPGPTEVREATKDPLSGPGEVALALWVDAFREIARRAVAGSESAIEAFARLTGSTVAQVREAIDGVQREGREGGEGGGDGV